MLEFWLQTDDDSFRFQGPRVTVGRDARCSFVLPDRSVLPLHATIIEAHGSIYVEKADLDALTFVNRAPIHVRTELFDGDLIDIGPWTLVFRCAELERRVERDAVAQTFTPSDIAIVRTVRVDESMEVVTGDPDDTTSSQII